MRFDRLKNALLTVGVPVAHYESRDKAEKYIVWQEEGQAGGRWADNRMQHQAIYGSADYFTKEEYDANVDLIQNALNAAEISWKLESVQYEEDTGYTHYEWEWELFGTDDF